MWNDYYSWERELETYQAKQQPKQLTNAIDTLMHLHTIDALEAKTMLLQELNIRETQYCKLKDAYIKQNNPGVHVLRYLDAAECLVAGSVV